jgi:hypothetical protein
MKVSINHFAASLILLSGSFLFGCKRDNEKSDAVFSLPQEFIDRGDFYCEASKEAYQEKKYVHSKCDGAGFTSLYSTRCGGVDLSVFEDSATGKPYRSPTHDCFSTGASKSEYSRDMLLMRMVGAWRHKDLAWVNRMISYGEKNSWVICDAIDDATKIGRCVVSPSLYSVLYDMQSRLEGVAPSSLTLQKDEDAVGLKDDFEAHLEVLKIWLEGEIYGAITDTQLMKLEGYAKRESENALFLAVYAKYSNGDFSNSLKSLERFPAGRLPNSSDWATEYLYQRSMMRDGAPNKDWKPGPDASEVFSGTDYNFVIYVISGK